MPRAITLKPKPVPEVIGGRLLWRLPEAAAALGLSPRSLKRLQELGCLPPGAVIHVRIEGEERPQRRFSVEVLAAWVRQGCPTPR